MPTVDELNIKIEAEAEKANSALDKLIGNFTSLSSGLKDVNLGNLEKIASSASKSTNEVKNTKKEILSSTNAIKTFSQQFANVGKDFEASSSLTDVRKEIAITEKDLERFSKTESEMIDSGSKLDSVGFIKLQRRISDSLNKLDVLLAKEKELIALNEAAFDNIKFHGLDVPETTKEDNAPRITTIDTSEIGYNAEAMKAVFGEQFSEIKNWNQAVEMLGRNAGEALNKAESAAKQIGNSFETEKVEVDDFRQSIEYLKTSIQKTNLGKISSAALSILKIPAGIFKIGKGIAGVIGKLNVFRKKATDTFGGGLKNVLKYSLGIRSLFVLFNRMRTMMKEGFNNLAQYSDETNNSLSSVKSSLTQFKNSLAVAFSPLLSVVAPALTSFINLMSSALNKFGQFVAALTGKSSAVQSLKVSEDYAAGLSNETGKTAENVKKIQKGIRSFDELKTISIGNDSDSGSSGTSGSSDVSDMFETVDISSNISGFAEQVKEAWKNADFTEIGTIFGEKLNSALSGIKWDKIKETVKNIASSVATFLNGFIGETDWELVGKTFSEGINTVLGGARTFIDTFDWNDFGSAITTGISGFFGNIEWDTLGATVSSAFTALFNFVSGLFEGIEWDKLPGQIVDGIVNFFDGFEWKETLTSLGDTIKTILSSALQLAVGVIATVGAIVQDSFTKAKEKWDKFKDKTATLVAGAKEKVKGALGDLKTKFAAVKDKTATLTAKAKNSMGNAGKKISDAWDDIKSKTVKLTAKFVDNFTAPLKKAWNAVAKSINGFTSKINKALNINIGTLPVFDGYATGGFPESGKGGVRYVGSFASGGLPEDGWFRASHGEIMGRFDNGQSVVANNKQITDGISAAVYQGNRENTALLRQEIQLLQAQNELLSRILQKDTGISANDLFNSVRQSSKEYYNRTGNPAFI